MTAHGSKGLEYDYVFLPYATEEVWMSQRKGNFFLLPGAEAEGDDIRDSRRLFYVALTRAKRHAVIIYGLSDDLGKTLSPLRFIDELNQELISRLKLPAVARDLLEPSGFKLESKQLTEFLDYTKNSLLEKGLSVTALNHYCDCPNKFFYRSILKLPEAPNSSAEKGNAMHEAIAVVWSLPNKTEASIAAALFQVTNSYFSKSLLPVFEKEAVLKELAEEIPVVAKALVPHFSADGVIATEKWVETNFVSNFSGQPINLRLHGKLDALRESARELDVYDYKTKEGMSLREIKGETQNSDGGYFRQLVFYKLLLVNNSIYREKAILPALVFVKPDDKGRCPIVTTNIEEADLNRVKSEIERLIQDVWSGQLFTKTCDDPDCYFCHLRAMTASSF
jgi:DNA helicase-2/ATP-dependent DNA helicase PcrA